MRCKHGFLNCVRCGHGSYRQDATSVLDAVDFHICAEHRHLGHLPCGRCVPIAATFPRYHKPCPYPSIDVYRVLVLFEVADPCIQHAVKKLLVAGGRGAKDAATDVGEAIASLQRWQEMRAEEAAVGT